MLAIDEYILYKFGYQVGLKPKTFYRVRVSAKNDVAEGPVSDTKEFETAYSELPIPTDIKTKVAEDNSLTITFTAVRDPDDHSNIIQVTRTSSSFVTLPCSYGLYLILSLLGA
ncbi:hypothetical protein COOONC_09881 [Cooperia oncophora]